MNKGSIIGARLYLFVTAVYALSRPLLWWAGVRFSADYRWQHFLDVDLLKHRLAESILNMHAFTPLISLLAGLVFKVSEAHAAAIHHALFLVLGAAFVNALAYLLLAVGLRPAWAAGVALFFSLTPAFIYFENLLHYTFISAALVTSSAALFHRAQLRPSFARWSAFFWVCALLAYLRTTFHLVWLVAVLGWALASARRQVRIVLVAAALPLLLVVALYVKNSILFGFFGTSSNFGVNLAHTTIRQLPQSDLAAWVKEGRISPLSAVNVFGAPEEYAPWIDISQQRGVPALDQTRKTTGEINYNHWCYAEVNRFRVRDDLACIKARPGAYAATVLRDLGSFFGPTTRWHPHDAEGRSPHAFNRRTLGGWETAYNTILHSFPLPKVGLYAILIPLFVLACFLACFRAWRSRRDDRAADRISDRTLLYLVFCAVYVSLMSCMFSNTELTRYRFEAEAAIWIVCLSLIQRIRVAPHPFAPVNRRPGGG